MVSVIIPVYNRQDVVSECVQSVLAQSDPDFEIILIDDGSTDRTMEICRELAMQDTRIVLLEGGHGGVSAARNRGLEAARGEYLLFLDSDDVIHPMLLEALVAGLEDSGAAMGGTGVQSIRHDRWQTLADIMAREPGPGVTTHQDHETTRSMVFEQVTPINLIGGVIMRRALVGDTRFRTDLFIGEDFYFVYENLIKGTDSVFLKQKWYYARMHPGNSSWNYSFEGFWTRFYRRELVWKSEEALGYPQNARREKRSGFACFLSCLKANDPRGPVAEQMRQTMREYRRILLPALNGKDKLRYYLSVYTPSVYLTLSRIKKKLRKR